MIVSHQHKFIFIPIPKTATHAIRFALRPQLGKNDWEQVELFHKSRIPLGDLPTVNHGHISSIHAKELLGDNTWNSYFKFSFVRNPYDRFISYSFFKKNKSVLFQQNPSSVMKLLFKDPNVKRDILFKPQFDFITNEKGELMIDFIGRYEDLQNDYNLLCKKLGLDKVKLEKLNSSHHNLYQQYYDIELRKLVGDYYKRDFNLLNYSF